MITGTISQNTFLQLPNFGFTVTFPAATKDVTLQPNTQQTLSPASYGALIVNAGATLSLSSGTYFFTSFDIESNATISCSSGSAQVVVYVSGNVIFRGKTIEKTGGRPKFFLGAFGTGTIAVGGPFTGTIAAPQAQITLNTVGTAGHSGAFFGQSIQVRHDGAGLDTAIGEAEIAELRDLNGQIWDIEDQLRACEVRREFGPRFVELARSVYRLNDRRALLKRRIDERRGSQTREEKIYSTNGQGRQP